MLLRQKHERKLIAAICASPQIVLQPLGILDDVEFATCHPSVKGAMKRSNDLVCFSNNVLTSQGPGTAIPFSLRLVSLLVDHQKAHDIAQDMVAIGY